MRNHWAEASFWTVVSTTSEDSWGKSWNDDSSMNIDESDWDKRPYVSINSHLRFEMTDGFLHYSRAATQIQWEHPSVCLKVSWYIPACGGSLTTIEKILSKSSFISIVWFSFSGKLHVCTFSGFSLDRITSIPEAKQFHDSSINASCSL